MHPWWCVCRPLNRVRLPRFCRNHSKLSVQLLSVPTSGPLPLTFLHQAKTNTSRDALARHGPGNPQLYGTARHGKSWREKSWHGKILARHGTKNHARWTRSRSNSMIFEQIIIPEIIYIYMTSLFVGRPFFRKLFASKNDAERYRRNILGPNFQKHPLFQFKAPIFLEAPNLWVRCRRRFFPTQESPIFLEAPNLWVRCRRLFFPRKKKAPIFFGSP